MVRDTLASYCPNCDVEVDASIVCSKQRLKVRGHEIAFEGQSAVCPICEMHIGDSRIESANLKAAYAEYRKQAGLLTSGEIAAIRNAYGLSLRAFARFLGFGEQTVARYEAGSLQDTLHDEVMRKAATASGAAELLERNKSNLKASDAAKVYYFIEHSIPLDHLAPNTYEHASVPSAYNGYRTLDPDRIQTLAILLAKKCKRLYVTKLQKALFFCDFAVFAATSVSLTGLSYARATHGPVMENWRGVLNQLVSNNAIELISDANSWGELVIATSCGNSTLTNSELEIVDRTVRFVNSFDTAGSLSEYSHELDAWRYTGNGALISYEDAANQVALAIERRLARL